MRKLLCLVLAAALGAFAGPPPVAAQDRDTLLVYIGTYTGKVSKGIYLLELDLRGGKLSDKATLVAETRSPSFLAVHPRLNFLYCANETADFGDKKAGTISAFAMDSKSGKLTFLNKESSGGGAPCHLVVDHSGHCVLAANYSGGSVIALPIGEDGKLGAATSFHQHKGASVNKSRQEGPHAHSINVDIKNDFAFAADLGIDKVLIYRLDPAKGKLTAHGHGEVPPGGGPRHLAVAPNNRFVYTNNELTSSVTVFTFNEEKGTLAPLQTISTLPDDFKGSNSTAECVIHPSGKFLYVSNRGHDSIAMFTIERKGTLKPLGHEPTRGKTPRNFAVEPGGQFLLAANQSSNSVAVFRIDQETGRLSATGQVVEVPSPVCVRFVAKGR
jgi:6-phosphogluconolactonase